MAETLTYDSGTDSVTQSDNLTPEEKDSLQVGEKMAEEQAELLAGKYKNAEDLEQAYIELQKKLGDNSETTTEEEVTEETTDEPEAKEESAITSLLNEASKEFYDNENSLSEETIEKFSEMSSRDLVTAYIEGLKNQPEQNAAPEQVDLTESQVNQMKNSVGGDAEYSKLVSWASDNLDQESTEAFDSIINSGNMASIKLAISGLQAQYENANGYEGRMLSGKPPSTSGDVFRSQPELVAAMSDPRYDKDPAYRQDVIDKLDRSDLNF